jgi:hypothetical protein
MDNNDRRQHWRKIFTTCSNLWDSYSTITLYLFHVLPKMNFSVSVIPGCRKIIHFLPLYRTPWASREASYVRRFLSFLFFASQILSFPWHLTLQGYLFIYSLLFTLLLEGAPMHCGIFSISTTRC